MHQRVSRATRVSGTSFMVLLTRPVILSGVLFAVLKMNNAQLLTRVSRFHLGNARCQPLRLLILRPPLHLNQVMCRLKLHRFVQITILLTRSIILNGVLFAVEKMKSSLGSTRTCQSCLRLRLRGGNLVLILVLKADRMMSAQLWSQRLMIRTRTIQMRSVSPPLVIGVVGGRKSSQVADRSRLGHRRVSR